MVGFVESLDRDGWINQKVLFETLLHLPKWDIFLEKFTLSFILICVFLIPRSRLLKAALLYLFQVSLEAPHLIITQFDLPLFLQSINNLLQPFLRNFLHFRLTHDLPLALSHFLPMDLQKFHHLPLLYRSSLGPFHEGLYFFLVEPLSAE